MNSLAKESSPYLLQHAHNPVNWYPWGDEALQKAKDEDKPILVSIGYAACHWCHVMERESFENEGTAAIMNEHFVNIKIDREERPDLDHIYMDAVQAIAGNGGWPLNVFLTPDCKPFYGGTYFPPVRAFNRASWTEVLHGVHNLFKEKRNEVEAQAEELTQHIGKSSDFGGKISKELMLPKEELFHKNQLHEIAEQIMKQADDVWGGFGKAPKFPQTQVINYLLQYHVVSGNKETLDQAILSLDKMISGGIYDHVGGGFARYSTDEEWLAPHFEKMLYDNALLLSVLADAFRITKKELYAQTILETITFLSREMLSEEGGFYSAIDADSEGVEGKFYVWELPEVVEALGDDAKVFIAYYDITENGNWERTNIPRVRVAFDEFALAENIDRKELSSILQRGKEKLLRIRSERIRPQLDDKIILGWNALLVTALCKCSAALCDESMKKLAIRNFDFLLKNFTQNIAEGFYHTYKNGHAKFPAFLDDYAFLIEAGIHLQEITSDTDYLEKAKAITGYVIENFSDENSPMFFYTHKDQKDVIVRKKEVYDGATPSPNSVMAQNLQYLSVIFNNPVIARSNVVDEENNLSTWHDQALQMVQSLVPVILKYPTSFSNWAQSVLMYVTGVNEVAIVGAEYASKRDEFLKQYFPALVLQSSASENKSYPLLEDKTGADSTLFYVCRNYSCLEPINDLLKSSEAILSSSKI